MKKSNILSHFAASLVVTILCGAIYVSVQQSHRSVANDPQLQIALDMKNAIEKNLSLEKWMTKDSIELSGSLSVFKVVYNKIGEPTQSTALLDGSLPKLPKGVFDFTRKQKEDVLTWQPRQGIRMAMVVEAVQSPAIGFVAVGRSLKETEKRVSNLTLMLFISWLGCMGVIFIHFLVTWFIRKKSI